MTRRTGKPWQVGKESDDTVKDANNARCKTVTPQNGQTLNLQRHAASPAGSVETILELDEPSWPCEIVIFPFCLDNRIQLLQKISSCYSYCYCYPAILRDFSIRGKHGGTIHVKTRQQRNVSMSRKFNAFLLVRHKPFQHQIHRRNLQLLGNVLSALFLWLDSILVFPKIGITGYYCNHYISLL